MRKFAAAHSLCFVRASLGALVLVAGVAQAGAPGPVASTELSVPHRWVLAGQLSPQAQGLLAVLRRVEDLGLAHQDFAPLLVAVGLEHGSVYDSTRLENLTNTAALLLINQLHHGRIDPLAAGYALKRQRAPLDTAAALRRLATADDVPAVLATIEPQSAQYRALKQALVRYRRLPTNLASLPAPGGTSIREGDTYAGAGQLRELLAALADASPPSADPSDISYDAGLANAVARFQLRHGLLADGVLGTGTFAALTVPIARRVRQIELTLERWRWLPDIAPPAVIVNVPQYMLYALPGPADPADSRALKIPVIVGQTARQTPIFDSTIESVVFRPYWNVPRSIVLEELLPLISRDLEYLARHAMEIVRGNGDDAQVLPANAASVAALRTGSARLRQRPGPGNALGLIKFILPNPFSVYLHSTPEAQLFARERRALSHGCIRVSDASALAAYLLKRTPGDWSADAIEAATCGADTLTVHLATPVPVFMLYGTVVIDADGAVLFFEDVYGYDRRLDELLSRSPRP
jgi:murein L,D-transpeptidase YcbB/YkuD